MKIGVLSLSLLLAAGLTACQAPVAQMALPGAQHLSAQSQPKAQFYGTAKDDLYTAQSEARRWDRSAQLVKVEADHVDEDGESWDWVYTFEAPGQRRALEVRGFRDVREVSKAFLGSSFREYQWRIDSDEAIKSAQKSGLNDFPIREMTLEDRFGFMWEIRSASGRRYRVDARTGRVQ